MTRVVVYSAGDCGLCKPALEVVRAAQAELGFELDVVDIGGDAKLELRYRAYLPVVEIDGKRAFTYFVEPDALRERLRAAVPSTWKEGRQAES
ncbi:MAG: glutaredoxin family protein [Actinobacteria bacterium]|nr:glutaredoxin family protein [Actinomycetota bacterium]